MIMAMDIWKNIHTKYKNESYYKANIKLAFHINQKLKMIIFHPALVKD